MVLYVHAFTMHYAKMSLSENCYLTSFAALSPCSILEHQHMRQGARYAYLLFSFYLLSFKKLAISTHFEALLDPILTLHDKEGQHIAKTID